MDWKVAEQCAESHMRWIGFKDAVVTPKGADGGVDVESHAAVAQVKHHKRTTGAPAVQQLYGVATARRKIPIFYSTSGYSLKAAEFATDKVALFTIGADGKSSPANERALALLRRAQAPVAPAPAAPPLRPTALAGRPIPAQIPPAFSGKLTKGRAWLIGIGVLLACGLLLKMVEAVTGVDFSDPGDEVLGELAISESAYAGTGKLWPFAVSDGVLKCRSPGQMITFTADGVTYALEGVLSSRLKDYGWYPATDILLDDPKASYKKLETTDVLHDGRGLCSGSPGSSP